MTATTTPTTAISPNNRNNPNNPITLYGFRLSGHTHRVELFLSLLKIPVRYVEIDLPGRQQKTPEFLRRNPFGQVPVIDDDGVIVADSNAILVYLARRYDTAGWLPREPLGVAAVQRWFSVAAGPLASGPAAARVARVFGKTPDAEAIQRAHALLAVIEAHLSKQPFLIGEAPSLADIAIYTYVAHAPEGGVVLDAYPHIGAWLKRIEGLDGFVPMQRVPS